MFNISDFVEKVHPGQPPMCPRRMMCSPCYNSFDRIGHQFPFVHDPMLAQHCTFFREMFNAKQERAVSLQDILNFIQPFVDPTEKVGIHADCQIPQKCEQRSPSRRNDDSFKGCDDDSFEGCDDMFQNIFKHVMNLDSDSEGSLNVEVDQISDVLKHVMNKLNGGLQKRTQGPSKWQHQVDCSGFQSENVSVRMSNRAIVVRAVEVDMGEDDSIFRKSIEKRIILPKTVLAKKVVCKMMPNHVLTIEGPYLQSSKSYEKPQTGQDTKKTRSAEVKGNGFHFEVFPGVGTFLYTSFPKDNTDKDKQPLKSSDPVTNKSLKAHQNVQGNERKQKKTEETNVPVTVVNKKSSTDEKQETPLDNNAAQDHMSKLNVYDKINAEAEETKEENHICQGDENNETSHFVTCKILDETTSAQDQHGNSDIAEAPYKVDLDDSEEDADSSNHDSESSFVLIPNSNNHNVLEAKEETTPYVINDVIKDIAESLSVGAENNNTTSCNNASEMVSNLTELITNAVPNMQKLIVDMKDTNQASPHGFDTETFAKIISETVPKLQDFIVNKKETDVSAAKTNGEIQRADTPGKSSKDPSSPEEKIPEMDFIIRLEMPVCSPESIRVTIDDKQNVLNVSAKKDQLSSNESVSINKNIDVPQTVDVSQLHCQFRDGLLSITAPYRRQSETVNKRDIPIRT